MQLYNEHIPAYRRLPASTALESWLFGIHPRVFLNGRRMQVTISSLEQDLAMDDFLVADCGQLHRLLTACFLHNGLFHILFNVGYLYTLAPLEAGAPGAFLFTFLVAGIAGNLAFLAAGAGHRALGASGGICGLIALELVSSMRMRQVRERKSVLRQIFGLVVMGVLLPGAGNWAHAGGFAAGFVLSLLTARRSGYRSPLLPWPLLALGLLLVPPARHFVRALAEAVPLAATQPGALAQGLRILT